MSQQFLTSLGTLAIAAVGFYFGTRAVQAARSGEVTSQPQITGISPNDGRLSQRVKAMITGSKFQEDVAVKIVKGEQSMPIKGATRLRASAIEVEFDIPTEKQFTGEWDIIITNPDGGEHRYGKAFTVTE